MNSKFENNTHNVFFTCDLEKHELIICTAFVRKILNLNWTSFSEIHVCYLFTETYLVYNLLALCSYLQYLYHIDFLGYYIEDLGLQQFIIKV